MKNLYKFITEKLRLDNTISTGFSDEELRNDYSAVSGAYTKAEKQMYAAKYGIDTNKFREIQLVILDCLRENRQKKKKFDEKDVQDLIRYDIKEKEIVDYLSKEPIEFVKEVFKYYKDKVKSKNILYKVRFYGVRAISIADKYLLSRYKKTKEYLREKGELDNI